jgi:hypothetical protein
MKQATSFFLALLPLLLLANPCASSVPRPSSTPTSIPVALVPPSWPSLTPPVRSVHRFINPLVLGSGLV